MNETVRIAPIDMPRDLKERVDRFAHEHGQMSFAAAVRYLLIKALEQEGNE